MSYNENLADRICKLVSKRHGVTEKKMFGGVAFLLPQGMFCGMVKDDLMVRGGPDAHEQVVREDRPQTKRRA